MPRSGDGPRQTEPQISEAVSGGRVVVTTASGRHAHGVRDVPGDPARTFSAAEVDAKFQRLVVPLAGKERARRWFSLASSILQNETALPTILMAVKDLGGIRAG